MASDFQSLYVLSSGLFFQQRKLEVVANNLANINTNGFKKVLLTAQALPVKESSQGEAKTPQPLKAENNFVYPVMGKQIVDTSGGELKKTDNPLDMAINGKGFFAIKVGDKVLYTRDGHFLLDKNGFLVNQDGFPVLDENGNPIAIGRASLEKVRVTRDGVIFVGTRRVARLKIVELQGVKHVGRNLYTGEEMEAKNYEILQGFVEGSNVNPVEEMTRMIETVRAYQSFANAMKTLDENNSQLINGILKA
jgi:flagellar basal-body rod protein FlgG